MMIIVFITFFTHASKQRDQVLGMFHVYPCSIYYINIVLL